MGGSTTTISYDYEDRITAIDYPGGGTNSFGYNGIDARTSKTDSTGSFSFRRDGATVTDEILSDGCAQYTPQVSDSRSGVSAFYHTDRLGSTTHATNASGATIYSRTADGFGNLLSSAGSSASPFGYVGAFGYAEDADSGLRLVGHRYYDSSIGRFMTRDPWKSSGNWYSYCNQRPTVAVDPSGLTAISVESHPINLPPGMASTIVRLIPSSDGGTIELPGGEEKPVNFVGETGADTLLEYLTDQTDTGGISAVVGGGHEAVAGIVALGKGLVVITTYKKRIEQALQDIDGPQDVPNSSVQGPER